jgi:uncharacterized protein YjbI with pentapeptide repeats
MGYRAVRRQLLPAVKVHGLALDGDHRTPASAATGAVRAVGSTASASLRCQDVGVSSSTRLAPGLVERWTTSAGRRLQRQVLSWLCGGAGQPDGLEQVDGRADLRGVALSLRPFARVGSDASVESGVLWDALDLRGAQLDSFRFFGCVIRDCLLDGACCHDWRLWGTSIVRTSFRRADLTQSALGTGEWRGQVNVWTDVAFDGARLNNAHFTGAVLERCTFRNLHRTYFQDCEFRACTLSGRLEILNIDGRGHQHVVDPDALDVDLRSAQLKNSMILGYHIDEGRLPAQPDLLVLHGYPQALQTALLALNGADSPVSTQVRGTIEYLLKAPGRADSDLCLDLGVLGPEVGAALRTAR